MTGSVASASAQDLCDELIQAASKAIGEESGRKAALKDLSALIVRARASHRALHRSLEERRRKTQEQLSDAEKVLLEMKNLEYELSYYKREVSRCATFRTEETDRIDLVPEDVFLKSADARLTSATDAHQRMLNRLTHELEERKRGREALDEEKRHTRQRLDKARERESFLLSLREKLREASAAFRPIYASLPHVERSRNASAPASGADTSDGTASTDEGEATARLLPAPLYVLYHKAVALVQTQSEALLRVRISGSAKDAQEIDSTQQGEQDIQALLQRHPLSVIVTLASERSVPELEFLYWPRLAAVGVCLTGSVPDGASPLCLSGICGTGHAKDGLTCPIPSAQILLERAGGTSGENVFASDSGVPLAWAQLLGGVRIPLLSYPPAPAVGDETVPSAAEPVHSAADCASEESIGAEEIFMRVKERLETEAAVAKQLSALASGKVPTIPKSSVTEKEMPPLAAISDFKVVNVRDVAHHFSGTGMLPEAALGNEARGRALTFCVGDVAKVAMWIPREYPTEAPLASLSPLPAGAALENDLRAIEEDVNSFPDDLDTSDGFDPRFILSVQVRKIATLAHMAAGRQNGAGGESLVRPRRGRGRLLPLVYHPGAGIYVHRVGVLPVHDADNCKDDVEEMSL